MSDWGMVLSALDPADGLARQNEKLLKITNALMRRVEQATEESGLAYAQFERAAVLEGEVRARTRELERALALLGEVNGKLAEANRAAQSARADLEGAIETIGEGFALFDEHDRLVLANSRFGLDMPDVRAGLTPGMTFDAYVEHVSRSAELALPQGESAAEWLALRRTRHRDPHVVFNVALRGERWLQISEHRTWAAGTVILQTDVTDMMRRHRAERDQLVDDQARIIRATIEHISEGVTIFDANGLLVGSNERAAELLALPVARFVPGALLGKVFAGVGLDGLRDWASASREAPFAAELTRSRNILLVSARQMPDGGAVVSFTDVTAERDALIAISEANETLERRVAERTLELERAVAEAKRANATKSRFVAAASHDLLQPLSAAKLYLAALDAGGGSALVGKAQSALGSVEALLGALLDISRLDAGGAALHLADVSLQSVLGQLFVEFQPLAARKGLRLRVVPSTALVRSDPTYLRRILQNLIANAVKYTTAGTVLVGVRRSGEFVRVEVWDTGPGIAPKDQRWVFQEFQRLGATASASDGLGLGLAIVERAGALLRHPIGLSSRVGSGSCFHVTLPLAPRRSSRPAVLEGGVALLVAADEGLRSAMERLLEELGMGVVEASGAEDAIGLLAEIGIVPDVAVVGPPPDDPSLGAATIRALRSVTGPTPALVATADPGAARSAELRQLRAAVVRVPPDAGTLTTALLRLMEGD